jgi:hypothetical protein
VSKPGVLCSICGRSASCEISQATGRPWCKACQKRRARCAGCGQVELIRGGTLTTPLCAICTRPDPAFWRGCPACGHPQLSTRSCTRCNLRQRLDAMLAGGAGDIRAELRGLHNTLASSERPNLVLAWLNKTATASVLRESGTGQRALSHAALDELPASKPAEHLRAILVATGTPPPRDEHLARLERWIEHTLAGRSDPGQRQLLHRYAVWHLLRRLRQRTTGTHTTHAQAVTVKRHVNAAIALLDGPTARGHTLASARQGDLDNWLTSDQASHRRDAGHFARWAHRHHLTSLEFPATRWHGPARTIDTQARWAQARWLLHDHTLNPADRVAGLLILLYAPTPAAISRLTLEQVQTAERAVHLRLGREPITLPEPLTGPVLDLIARRRGHATLGDQGTSPWLFPGGRPGLPISAYQLAERLPQLGLRPAQSRTTALFSLATELPAPALARLPGIHIKVAVAWQHASTGDWTTYAAGYSHRKPATTEDTKPALQHTGEPDAFRQLE